MKASHTFLLLGTAVALLACGKQQAAANNSANAVTAAPAEANTAAAAPAAPAAAGTVNADFMVGKWSAMGEDCSHTIDFRKDGTVTTPIGDGKWSLAGDKLSFDYGDGSKQPPSSIKMLTHDRIEITRGSGGKEIEKRC
jgi:hypothetical protein